MFSYLSHFDRLHTLSRLLSPACASQEALMFKCFSGGRCYLHTAVFPGVGARLLLAVWMVMALAPQASFGQVARSAPGAAYYGSFDLLYAGDYREALRGFASERGIRTVQSRWIDSICIHTMTGESY